MMSSQLRRQRRRLARRRLNVEPLEDRRLLAVFTVNTSIDRPDLSPGDGVVDTGVPGEVTLRAAVMEANALGGNNMVDLDGIAAVLTIAGAGGGAGDLNLDFGTLEIANGVIDAGGDTGIMDRVISSGSGATLNLTNVGIQGGRATGDGGGVMASGGLGLFGVTFTDNRTPDNGGGLYAAGSTSINLSLFENNTAGGNGGGMFLGGLPTVTRTTVVGNTAGADGGGIYATFASASVSLSTLSGNTASATGGGIAADESSLFLEQSTLTLNQAATGGGAAALGLSTSFDVNESIIAQNVASSSDPDVTGDFSQFGPVLIGDVGSSSGFSGPTDLVGGGGNPVVNARLLALDGVIHELAPDSPAIDAGFSSGGPLEDQRFVPRGLDGLDGGDPANDLGAAELFRILIDDDIAPGTVGAVSADLMPGGYSGQRAALLENGRLINAVRGEVTALGRSGVLTQRVFEDSLYVNVGGSVFSLASTMISTQALAGEDMVVSRGSFSGPSGLVDWTVESTIMDDQPLIQRRIFFDSFDVLDGVQLIHYLEPGVNISLINCCTSPGRRPATICVFFCWTTPNASALAWKAFTKPARD